MANRAGQGGVVLLVLLVGCQTARHVQVEKDCGVVAIPRNTNTWPDYYRQQAEKLMQERCPHGYEIVREEEFVTGTTTHTNTTSDTKPPPALVLGGAEESSDSNKKRNKTSGGFGALAIPLGEERKVVDRVTTVQKETEWRIHYRAK